jgi:dihydroorotate dehydrogenase
LNFFLKIFKFLPPEFAHSASLNSLNLLHKSKLLVLFNNKIINKNEHTIFGMKFRNKLGTAAGLDKNGDYIDALGALGFGFLEVGTVTPKPQYGNPKPRIFRNYSENSIINRLGFNNKGIDYLVNNLKKRKYGGVVGVNIGANKSSPNTPDLRDLHLKENLQNLITSVENKIAKLNFKKPIFLKISPDETDESIEMIIDLVKKSSITGLVATNTTIDKENLNNKKLKKEDGGVSGQPLMDKSTNKISLIKSKCSDIPIIGVGGVMSKKDYLTKLNAGADLVQIYTGFIIKGPDLINQIVRD